MIWYVYFKNKVIFPNSMYNRNLMPGPCSGKKFDINFGNRLYSKEKRPMYEFRYYIIRCEDSYSSGSMLVT